MAPSIVASFIDKTKERLKALTVGCVNLGFCFPYWMKLVQGGHTPEKAMQILPNHYRLTLKPHPGLDINIKNYPKLKIQKTSKSLENVLDKFDLVIDIQSKIRNTLILKRIPTVNFYSSTYNYLFCSNKKKYTSDKNINQKTLSNLGKFFDTDIKKVNYDINNLDKSILDEAKKILPNKGYVGFSMTHANLSRKKDWPIEKFIELAKRTKETNKIPVFFVEKKNYEIVNKIKDSIADAFFPEHNSDLASPALVTALASRLEIAVSIDNGIMHMMSLAQIPLIVLFGPTKPEKFAPDQKNITVIDSKELYKTSDISKIRVEDLLRHIV